MKKKDGTHLLFIGIITAVVIAATALGIRANNQAEHNARVAGYLGRDDAVNRTPLLLLALVALVVIGGLIAWWVQKLRAIDRHNH